ncbi:MAG: adenosyl-hopene transferase HpnH, partial [Chloroflexota bacterium]|nr:adenosyl-hopene transferase HpnH [Chloroflexota bacterium]
AGGEPLVHREIGQIVEALISRKRFVYLCTNAIMMRRRLDLFRPSPYFSWSIHIDGLRERHDESVCRQGVFDKAVEACREAKRRGFRVSTNTTFFDGDDASSIRAVLDFLNDELQVDVMQISPGYAYEKAPDQEHFLGVDRTRAIFRQAFADGRRDKWRLNHSPVFLDFLEGKRDLECTPWGIPCYSVFGWQRPCYLMADGGYAPTYRELLEDTDWSRYGRGRNPKCANCMAHCGYEPTAVMVTAESLRESVRALGDVFGAPAPAPAPAGS